MKIKDEKGRTVKQKKTAPPKRAPSAGRPGKKSRRKSDADNKSGVGKVVIKNEFYRDGYRISLRIAVIQSFIMVGLIAAMFFVIQVHQPENRYFATTNDGRLIPMTALNSPNLSKPALVSWAAQAATEAMTFGFNDYRRRLREASKNFTSNGWKSFTTSLQSGGIIEAIEANSQIITAAPSGAPMIVSEKNINGRYTWKVQIPMVISRESGSVKSHEQQIVELTIVRVTRLENPNGVGIAQWNVYPGRVQ